MRLVELTANKETFHPVRFRPSGVSLVVGSRTRGTRSTDTYNGVGKSLVISLIHFCLGSAPRAEYGSKLAGWVFVLRFEHAGKEYRASRSTDKQNVVDLDGKELKLSQFREQICSLVFDLPPDSKGLTLRSLVTQFIRPSNQSYNSYDVLSTNASPYDNLLRLSFLLGLDLNLVRTKKELRLAMVETESFRKNIKKDKVFQEYFTGDAKPEIALLDYGTRLDRLRDELHRFNVAKNYHEMQETADDAARELQKLRNEKSLLENAIRNIKESMKRNPSVTADYISRLFDEVERSLPDHIVHTLHEVSAFHQRLMENRIQRLAHELQAYEEQAGRIDAEIQAANVNVDELRRFLGTHGALDEFVALTEEVNRLELQSQKLRQYVDLLEKYNERMQELGAEMYKETIKASVFLRHSKVLLSGILATFRRFSSAFYGERPGGLTVENNERADNKIRFDIDVRIEDDASDGINEIKILCFDLALLVLGLRHEVKFVFHDSRLFSDVDIRQRATAFKLARQICDAYDVQYIASLNEDQIDAMRDQFTKEEFKECIEDAIILKLTDESAAGKLLGIQVNLQRPD